jgi:hypothetical protein
LPLRRFSRGWSCLAAVGVAQRFIDFILRLHFIKPFLPESALQYRAGDGVDLAQNVIVQRMDTATY